MKFNNLLTIGQLDKKQIQNILDLSMDLEKNNQFTLQNKNIIFAFEKPSLRTTIASEVAINHLGGNVIYIKPEIFFGSREPLKDTVKNVCKWCDAIFARVYAHQTLLNINKFSTIPVVNALCDQYHPMQALADLLTIQQKFDHQKTSLAFVGDANNVAFSLIEIMLKFGHDVRFAGPQKYFFSNQQQHYFKHLAMENCGSIFFSHDPCEAVSEADVIYTDAFVSMGEEKFFKKKIKHFSGFQVNKELFSYAKKHAMFMHCLPAHRGVEVSNEIIDSAKSLIYQQAENRMIAAKGVFSKLIMI